MNTIIQQILDSYEDEMIETLQQLIRIKSVVSESKPSAPFGEGIQEALDFIIKLGLDKEFECVNYDNYACELNLGDAIESVGVVSHLDVVPEGSGWTYDPYGGAIIDGNIYGRGAVDDKGALIAAFYACCAIKDSGVNLSKKIKHIIGTNEESGKFACIEYYKEHAEVPSCGIVPDSWFPAAYAEKGFYNYQFSKRIETSNEVGRSNEIQGIDINIIEITGGEALNIVAPFACAEVFASKQGIDRIFEALKGFKTQERIIIEEKGNRFLIKAIGKAAHASTPEIGVNAISILLDFLGQLEFSPVSLQQAIQILANQVANDTDGRGLGVKCSDHTGELTNNIGIISYASGFFSLKMNIRCPITITPEELEARLAVAASVADMEYELLNYNPHFYMAVDDPLIELLVRVYQEITGDKITKPKAHGGGSYARILKNFVPFGPSIEGEELCFHKQDEHISCERLLLLSKIYAEALYQLAK
jgi:succinyl-diaminopimelate desuccinylase